MGTGVLGLGTLVSKGLGASVGPRGGRWVLPTGIGLGDWVSPGPGVGAGVLGCRLGARVPVGDGVVGMMKGLGVGSLGSQVMI